MLRKKSVLHGKKNIITYRCFFIFVKNCSHFFCYVLSLSYFLNSKPNLSSISLENIDSDSRTFCAYLHTHNAYRCAHILLLFPIYLCQNLPLHIADFHSGVLSCRAIGRFYGGTRFAWVVPSQRGCSPPPSLQTSCKSQQARNGPDPSSNGHDGGGASGRRPAAGAARRRPAAGVGGARAELS